MIADADMRSGDYASGVGPFFAHQAAQQCGLARAVRAEYSPALAAQNVERQVLEQRPIIRLGQPLDAQHNVAGAIGRRKAHRWRFDMARRRNAFQPGQLFSPVFGLGVVLPIMISPNEVFGLGDEFLLPLVGAGLHFQPFGLLPPIGGKVADVGVDRPLKQLQCSIGHLVEKIAVVADHDHRLRAIGQKSFEPGRGFDIEMVRRLVQQHHVRLGQQQPRQEQSIMLAAAQLLDRLSEVLPREAQPLQHPLDAVVDVVSVSVR